METKSTDRLPLPFDANVCHVSAGGLDGAFIAEVKAICEQALAKKGFRIHSGGPAGRDFIVQLVDAPKAINTTVSIWNRRQDETFWNKRAKDHAPQ